jgi:hypothetical protein
LAKTSSPCRAATRKAAPNGSIMRAAAAEPMDKTSSPSASRYRTPADPRASSPNRTRRSPMTAGEDPEERTYAWRRVSHERLSEDVDGGKSVVSLAPQGSYQFAELSVQSPMTSSRGSRRPVPRRERKHGGDRGI